MLAQIEQWIDKTNSVYAHKRICCEKFANEFEGFYPNEFLKTAFYVVVDKIPKPDFTGLRELGLSNFIDMDVAGITYKNTYYILPSAVHNLRVHFHELVHVVQWRELGAHAFIMRYINEIQTFGYNDAPLEIMAYELDEHYTSNGNKFNIPDYITQQL
jgi:hypothetical protein